MTRPSVYAQLFTVCLFLQLSIIGIGNAVAQKYSGQKSDGNNWVTQNIPLFSPPSNFFETPAKVPDKIRFLTTDDFPPFSFRDGEGRLMGFNVDLARAICEEMEIACSLQIKPFSQLLPALEGREGDAIIAGISQTPNRLDKLLYSKSYMRFPGVFIIPIGSNFDPLPEQVKGSKVSVVKNSRHEAFLERFFPDVERISFNLPAEARASLVKGQVDAHFGDAVRLSFWLDSNSALKCCQFSGGPWLDPLYFGEKMSVAVRPSDQTIKENIDLALDRLQSNGRLSELYLRYFPISYF
ncbi:transporter substrate-binding domain-containing protein [Flexibacterium corallicola]|uniref:transporter substrate-binding domain-containing protein n=1 Tax=Flexibacterium corallicola TaxID=3037259 RepID=UPI00286F2313|nr:transporter substrate-binding domain-containing protein [Pseudovibrio sp. M1P-2-3]